MISGQGFSAGDERRLRELRTILDGLPFDPDLRRRVLQEMRGPADQVAEEMRQAVSALPKPAPSRWKAAGAASVRVVAALAGPSPKLSIELPRTSGTRGPWLLNDGKWRHPLFGNRSRWFAQEVRPAGWFDETGRRAHGRFERAAGDGLEAAARVVADHIEDLNRFS